jgi:NitT/TauT family transport system substrate-binding protein
MSRLHLDRRALVTGGAAIAGAALLGARGARAATKVRFQANWYAEAEHGGFYHALATGLYEKAGLDVEIRQGGPQLNVTQLLLGGEADFIMGYDIQVLSGRERGLPVKAVATSFQVELQGIMARPDVKSLADLKGRKIYVSSSAYTSYWPWLKKRFGFTDDMTGTKAGGLQTFFADPASAVTGYVTHEPFVAMQRNVPVKFLMFSDEGYPTYTNPIVTTDAYIQKNGEVVRAFLRASMEGWRNYLREPEAGDALIKKMNPKMDDAQIAFSYRKMKELEAVEGRDARTMGIGIMTEERWRRTRDFMVDVGLLKPETDWRQAFTLDYIKDLRVMM